MSGKPSVQPQPTYIIPVTTVWWLVRIYYNCLPCTLAIGEELWECDVGVTVCNIELLNKATFSYWNHSIHPHFQLSSPPPSPSPPSPTPPSQSPASGILLFDYSSMNLMWHPPTREARSTATSLLPAKPVLLRHAKPNPQIPACSQWSHFHPYQQSLIHHNQLAPSKGSFAPTIEVISTATSDASFTPTSEARSTATSLLPAKPDTILQAKPDLLLPVKPDPALTACSQGSQIVREVRVSIPPLPVCFQRSQIECYQRS